MIGADADDAPLEDGPFCPACGSEELAWAGRLGRRWHGQCRHCGMAYSWRADLASTCSGCGAAHDPQETGTVFCEGCESDGAA